MGGEVIAFEGWRVPLGFTSDGCTWSPEGSWRDACVLHDFLRRYAIVSVSEADKILRRCMISLGAPAWVARIYWIGVKVIRPFFKATQPLPKQWSEYARKQ